MTPSRAELRRLNAILRNEEYGPALVRLGRTEQREILDLISANRGKEARSRILAHDTARRAKVRERAATRRSNPPAPRRSRREDFRAWAQWMHDNIARRTPVDELMDFALQNAHDADWRRVEPIMMMPVSEGVELALAEGSRDAVNRESYSPFWYHLTQDTGAFTLI